MSEMAWPLVALGEVLAPVARAETPDPDRLYRLIGVKWWGEGAYQHAQKPGTETQAPVLFRMQADDIVINKIWARHGSVAVVQPDLDGAYGSAEFPTFRADDAALLPAWVRWWSRSPECWAACGAGSFGSSGKNRIRPEQFLGIRIPLPPLDEQRRIVARLDAVAARLQARAAAAERQEAELAAMLTQAFARITAGSPRACMADVAPLVRRPVEVTRDASYEEIGARAFGRGLFFKPTLRGDSLTWQKLFRIEAGDLVISNIKAWEGAFAVAGSNHHGKVASHRYLTCVADQGRLLPGVLWFFLQSRDGLAQIEAASPGSADRNRTLAQDRLAAIEVPLPPLDAQRWFEGLRVKADALRALNATTAGDAAALLPAMLHDIFGRAAC